MDDDAAAAGNDDDKVTKAPETADQLTGQYNAYSSNDCICVKHEV